MTFAAHPSCCFGCLALPWVHAVCSPPLMLLLVACLALGPCCSQPTPHAASAQTPGGHGQSSQQQVSKAGCPFFCEAGDLHTKRAFPGDSGHQEGRVFSLPASFLFFCHMQPPHTQMGRAQRSGDGQLTSISTRVGWVQMDVCSQAHAPV
eukprot:1159879-Pelagomonas_calceolata.AAC.1